MIDNVGKIKCHKPPMIGNGKHSTCKTDDDWEMVYGFNHIIGNSYFPAVRLRRQAGWTGQKKAVYQEKPGK